MIEFLTSETAQAITDAIQSIALLFIVFVMFAHMWEHHE